MRPNACPLRLLDLKESARGFLAFRSLHTIDSKLRKLPGPGVKKMRKTKFKKQAIRSRQLENAPGKHGSERWRFQELQCHTFPSQADTQAARVRRKLAIPTS